MVLSLIGAKNRRVREGARPLVTPAKNASVDLGAMPADGFDAAAKKHSGPRHVPWQLPRQWMDNTPAVRASEETKRNKPGAIVGHAETA